MQDAQPVVKCSKCGVFTPARRLSAEERAVMVRLASRDHVLARADFVPHTGPIKRLISA